MVQIIETSAVKALLADMLPWDREAVLDEYRPLSEEDDKKIVSLDDFEPYEVVLNFDAQDLMAEMDLADFMIYFRNHPGQWKELQELMAV